MLINLESGCSPKKFILTIINLNGHGPLLFFIHCKSTKSTKVMTKIKEVSQGGVKDVDRQGGRSGGDATLMYHGIQKRRLIVIVGRSIIE